MIGALDLSKIDFFGLRNFNDFYRASAYNPPMRQFFDLDSNVIYLNSGTHSITPRKILEAITKYQRQYERNPTHGLIEAPERLWDCQTRVAKVFGGEPKDFFLRSNVTLALNAFILGAKLPANSEILTNEREYGAIINACRFRAERDGLKLKVILLPTVNQEESIIRAISSQTSLVVMSHVFTSNGTVLEIDKVAAETRRRGVLLAIDGAHAPGAVPLNFGLMRHVDFYGGNFHKWMMGPKGTSFGWINPHSRDRIRPIDAGWTSFDVLPGYKNFAAGDQHSLQFLMKGCFDFAPFYALKDLFEFWDEVGAPQITKHRIERLEQIEKEMGEKLGWSLISPPKGNRRGPLLSYELPEYAQSSDPMGLMQQLSLNHRLQIQITNACGRNILRFSPHVYNTSEEIGRAVDVLTRFFDKLRSAANYL